jgi:capsule polysaccharide export protein KpsE/RkpR
LLQEIVLEPWLKQTKESVAHVIERRPDIEPNVIAYAEQDARVPGGTADEWAWILWERRRFLWRATLWGLVVSTIIAFVIPKQYESTTRLMPPDNQSSSGMALMAAFAGLGAGLGSGAGKGSGLSSLAGDLLGVKSSGDLFISILHSRTVEDRLVDRFDLRRIYGNKYRQDARNRLAKNTGISEDRKSGVISITITDRDAERAKQIAQAYVEELDRVVAQVSTSSARRERIFIEHRLVEVKQELDSASNEFSQYASKNTAVDITSQGKAMVEGAARLQGELIAAQSELEGLEQIYTPNNVRVRSVRARVDELRRQLSKMGGDGTNMGQETPDAAGQLPSIGKLPLLGVRWEDLYLKTKIQETVYELLNQQYELAKIQEAKEIPVVKVLDPADVPERKSFPPRTLIGLLGTFVALLAACTWILAEREWNSADQSNPKKAFAQEVFATLRSNGQRLWRDRRHLPRSVVVGTLGWLRSSNDRNGDGH